jgi:hypothetical protein
MTIIAFFGRPLGLDFISMGTLPLAVDIANWLDLDLPTRGLLSQKSHFFIVNRVPKSPILMIKLYQFVRALGIDRPDTFAGSAVFLEYGGMSGLEVHYLLTSMFSQIVDNCTKDGQFIKSISDCRRQFSIPKTALDILGNLSSPLPASEKNGNNELPIMFDMEGDLVNPLPVTLLVAALDAAIDLAVYSNKIVVVGIHPDVVNFAKRGGGYVIQPFGNYLRNCFENNSEVRKYLELRLSEVGSRINEMHYLISGLSNICGGFFNSLKEFNSVIGSELEIINKKMNDVLVLREMAREQIMLSKKNIDLNYEMLSQLIAIKDLFDKSIDSHDYLTPIVRNIEHILGEVGKINQLNDKINRTSGIFYNIGRTLHTDVLEQVEKLQAGYSLLENILKETQKKIMSDGLLAAELRKHTTALIKASDNIEMQESHIMKVTKNLDNERRSLDLKIEAKLFEFSEIINAFEKRIESLDMAPNLLQAGEAANEISTPSYPEQMEVKPIQNGSYQEKRDDDYFGNIGEFFVDHGFLIVIILFLIGLILGLCYRILL